MAEPRIQYCTAPDGVNLAFYTEGSGPPFVSMPTFGAFGHIQLDGLIPTVRRAIDYLTPRTTLVRYDHRGQGLSDREPSDDSLEAHVSDLLTIFDRLGLERAALHAGVYAGPVAITFAHRHPERISHLILAGTAARLAEAADSTPRLRVVRSMVDQDWELFTELVSRLNVGWPEHELGARLAAQMRASTTPEAVRRLFELELSWDVTALLSGIRVPTLVTYARGVFSFADDRWARALAAGIPGAQLRILDASQPNYGRPSYEFVSGEEATPDPAAAVLPEGTAIILFTDIVDSTALTEQLGDAAFRARATRLDAAMRSGIRECGGTPVEGKVLGDGVMAVFTSARQAIDGAQRCRAAADGTGLALHLGIHAGDVIREPDPGGQSNVYGGAVNIASRICGLSAPGEILVSDVVRGMARSSAGVEFDDRGDQEMKGVGDAVRVYAVRKDGAESPLAESP